MQVFKFDRLVFFGVVFGNGAGTLNTPNTEIPDYSRLYFPFGYS